MHQAHAYRERSHEYLSKAFAELEAGDLTHASEKGWGAAAQIVKAVADERGMEHRSHNAVFRAAQALARESHGEVMEIEFVMAGDLHRNFYEGTLDYDGVALRLGRVESFVARVERLLHNE